MELRWLNTAVTSSNNIDCLRKMCELDFAKNENAITIVDWTDLTSYSDYYSWLKKPAIIDRFSINFDFFSSDYVGNLSKFDMNSQPRSGSQFSIVQFSMYTRVFIFTHS